MHGFAFQKNCRFEHSGTTYLVMKINPDKTIVTERTNDGQISCWTTEELLKAFTEGIMRFPDPVPNDESYSPYQRPITDLHERVRNELNRRMAYISAIRDAAPNVSTPDTLIPIRSAVAQRIEDRSPPSFSTLHRWLKEVELHGEFRALIPRYDRRGPRHSRQYPRVNELFEEAAQRAFNQSPQATVQRVIEEFQTLLDEENKLRPPSFRYKMPSRSTCHRMFAQLDQYEKSVLRDGKRIAARKFKLAGVGTVTSRILERVEIDHTPLDLFLIDDTSSRWRINSCTTACYRAINRLIVKIGEFSI